MISLSLSLSSFCLYEKEEGKQILSDSKVAEKLNGGVDWAIYGIKGVWGIESLSSGRYT